MSRIDDDDDYSSDDDDTPRCPGCKLETNTDLECVLCEEYWCDCCASSDWFLHHTCGRCLWALVKNELEARKK
jgi:hypothetical protein